MSGAWVKTLKLGGFRVTEEHHSRQNTVQSVGGIVAVLLRQVSPLCLSLFAGKMGMRNYLIRLKGVQDMLLEMM